MQREKFQSPRNLVQNGVAYISKIRKNEINANSSEKGLYDRNP